MLGPPPPWLLRAVQAWDRARLALLCSRHAGLEVHPSASASFATARYVLAPGSQLRIAAGAVTERLPGRLQFHLYPGARVEIGAGTWLRTEVGDLHIVAFEGESQVRWFEGNFTDYAEYRKREHGVDAMRPHRIKYKPVTRG